MESFNDKLRSLGVTLGKNVGGGRPPAASKETIENLVPGEVCANQWGEYFLVSKQYPITMQHGLHPLFEEFDVGMLFRWAKLEGNHHHPLNKMAFIDTETTGLAGGTGTLAFMVGIGFYNENEFQLHQYFLRRPEEERAMLFAIEELMAHFDIAVSYNGRAFDVPLLNTRYVLNGMESPFKNLEQIDLLHLARRLWRNRLASRTLGNIEQEILYLTRSEEEVPGWMAPELYYDYLRNGNAAGVAPVFYHNEIDIVTLGALLIYMGKILSTPLRFNDLPGLDLMAIGKLYADLGELEQAIQIFEFGLNTGIPDEFYLECLMRQAEVSKKRGDYSSAIPNWEKALSQGYLPACEELAKYYEHQQKNYESAIVCVNKALESIAKMPRHSYQREQLDRSYQHRLERLLNKWRKNKVE